MKGPPLFQRSPRLQPDPPRGEAEIPAPPAAPSAPSMSLMSIVWSVIPGVLGGVLMYLVMRASSPHPGGYLLMSLPMMAMTYLAQVGNYFYQKSRYTRQMQVRDQKYRALLEAKARELEQARSLQQRVLRETDPTPAECLARAEQLQPRLWERSPGDGDWLVVRLGLGAVPFSVTVKTPRPDKVIDPDPLFHEAEAVGAQFAQVSGVPIRLPLREVAAAGLVGPRPAVLNAARGLALQLAAQHSPDEVKIVAIFPEEEAGDWAWMRWLPHAWDDDGRRRFLAAERGSAHRLLTELADLLSRRKLLQAMNKDGPATTPLPGFVFLFADPRLTENEAIVPLLLREGAALGALPLVLAARKEDLPKECRGIIEVTSGSGQLVLTAPALSVTPFLPDEVSSDVAERLARALAPVHLHKLATASEIPSKVTLLELLRAGQIEELDVLGRWQSGQPDRSLAVPIGVRTGGERLHLDLHEKAHGPHGLVAGATGSGKSELVQTAIAALAVSFHPHDVVFLMVDYKGGGMANSFAGLPHLVGTMTNLEEGNLARRALDALKAELKRRQSALGQAGVNHIDDYMRARRQGWPPLAEVVSQGEPLAHQVGRGQPLPPLPHLVIVVDEFAELKAAQPEFMRELVSAVRVGRSLGVHLILATQKPAGVVDEQIWSNTRFRLCLRVERPQDSQEVLKCPDAASITGSGRAYFQVGNNERFELFQAGWGGAPYAPGAAAVATAPAVAEVALDGTRYPLSPIQRTAAPAAGLTQLQALVQHLQAVAQEAGIEPLPSPWLPPLPEALALAQVRPVAGWDGHGWQPAPAWLEPEVGLLDDPEHQLQEPLRLPLGRDGHLAIYGAPGMGKTTLVQTLITSLALTHPPNDVQMYLVDCSGRTLSALAPLPHVGAVVSGDDQERLTRLMRYLLRELAGRKERLARSGVNTFAAYRTAGSEPLPAIVVVLDNYPALAAAYPEAEEGVAQVAREGGTLGLHLVLTATRPSAVRVGVSSNITLGVSLYLADRSEYSTVVGRTGGLEPAQTPGRALVKGMPPQEFQAALPVAGDTEWERGQGLKALLQELAGAWSGPRPNPIAVLPEVVPLCDLIRPGDGWPELPAEGALAVPVGLDVESLEPFRVDLQEGQHFAVCGPPEGGKSTFLQAWLLALAERLPPERLQLWLVDPGMGALAPMAALPQVRAYVGDAAGSGEAVDQIIQAMAERRQALAAGHSAPELVVAIDDLDVFREAAPAGARDRLEQLVRRERGAGVHLLVAGSTGAWNQYDGLTKALKELQTGFVLGSSDGSDLSAFNLRLPPGETARLLPPGEGFFVRRGRLRKVKAATPHAGEVPLAEWVRRIVGRAVVPALQGESG